MTDPKTPVEPVDCSEETAKRAGADQTSLKDDSNPAKPNPAEDEPEHTETSEDELDDALEDSMDGSDPPAALQP